MERRYNFNGRRSNKKSFLTYLIIIVIAVSLGFAGYFYLIPEIEYQTPKASLNHKTTWNKKTPLIATFADDDSGIKKYKITYIDNGSEILVTENTLDTPQKNLQITIKPDEIKSQSSKIKLILSATDNSKWNLSGNKIVSEFDILIDAVAPKITLLSNSYGVRFGGSFAVAANIADDNFDNAYVLFNDSAKFNLNQFYKNGNFFAIGSWPASEPYLKNVQIIATDKAGNKSAIKIPIYAKNFENKKDVIQIDDNFINSAIAKLDEMKRKTFINTTEAFLHFNRVTRNKNITTLHQLEEQCDKSFKHDFVLTKFEQLSGSAQLADFGDRRIYVKDNIIVDEQYHLGIDFASVKNAPIYVNNGGKVIFVGNLGIYGKTIVVDHGFGIMSLYAHTNSQDVKIGDIVAANQKIANTGMTGAVFGDHLHFGILVGGFEANPNEWMDEEWINNQIRAIATEAKRKIDTK